MRDVGIAEGEQKAEVLFRVVVGKSACRRRISRVDKDAAAVKAAEVYFRDHRVYLAVLTC